MGEKYVNPYLYCTTYNVIKTFKLYPFIDRLNNSPNSEVCHVFIEHTESTFPLLKKPQENQLS